MNIAYDYCDSTLTITGHVAGDELQDDLALLLRLYVDYSNDVTTPGLLKSHVSDQLTKIAAANRCNVIVSTLTNLGTGATHVVHGRVVSNIVCDDCNVTDPADCIHM